MFLEGQEGSNRNSVGLKARRWALDQKGPTLIVIQDGNLRANFDESVKPATAMSLDPHLTTGETGRDQGETTTKSDNKNKKFRTATRREDIL